MSNDVPETVSIAAMRVIDAEPGMRVRTGSRPWVEFRDEDPATVLRAAANYLDAALFELPNNMVHDFAGIDMDLAHTPVNEMSGLDWILTMYLDVVED